MDIPENKYGYWIDPKGKLHPVERSTKHVGKAAKILRKPPGGEGRHNDDYRDDLLQHGWTRVAMHSGRFVVQMPHIEVGEDVLKMIDRLVRQYHREASLPIMVEDPLTGECAGGHTVRAGDTAVLRHWNRIRRMRIEAS